MMANLMEIDEALQEIHRLRIILAKKAAASASTVRIVGPATKLVIDRLYSSCEHADQSTNVMIHMVGDSDFASFLTVGQIREFINEQEASQ
jgi:hypothetical protein